MENKSIETNLEAWLAFLSFTKPDQIEELISKYPSFKVMYQDIYELCLNTEKVMNMYSKELEILDHNTVMYMIDEMQEEIDAQKQTAALQKQTIARQKDIMIQQQELLSKKEELLSRQEELLLQQRETLKSQKHDLQEKDNEIAALKAQLTAAKVHQP